MQLAEALHMSLQEVRALPASEITLWMAYFKLKNTPEEKETETETSTADKFKLMMEG